MEKIVDFSIEADVELDDYFAAGIAVCCCG